MKRSMKMKTYLIANLILLICLLQGIYAQDIYVAVGGNNSHPGTKEKPVATLEAARDLIRQYKATHDLPYGGMTVWIGSGQYDQ